MNANNDEASKSDPVLRKVFIRTYGCQMNVYDSERIADLLRPIGYSSAENEAEADLVVLNTCHIREKAAEKVFSDLGRLKRPKRDRQAKGLGMTVAVVGCVAQAEGEEIVRRAPIVDFVVGPQAYHRLPEMLARQAHERGERLETSFAVEEKFDRLTMPREASGPAAFVTIQEGCNKFCTFCVVPYTRGTEVSRSRGDIVAEVRGLARQGVREVTLLGQNVNAWRGTSPAGVAWGLGALCRHLSEIDGVERIRFTTSHPRDMDDDLIDALGAEPKLMPYLHLPVQAGSDTVLKAMNRGHVADDYIRIVDRVRERRSDIALSGDFIVGFPGEEPKDFEATLRLVERVRYASAYSFKYSRRLGTPGAALPKQVAEDEKDRRLSEIQNLIAAQRDDFNKGLIGRRIDVLFEKIGRNEGQIIGRSPYLQSVHVAAPTSLIGSLLPVDIVGATPNALAGEVSLPANPAYRVLAVADIDL